MGNRSDPRIEAVAEVRSARVFTMRELRLDHQSLVVLKDIARAVLGCIYKMGVYGKKAALKKTQNVMVYRW